MGKNQIPKTELRSDGEGRGLQIPEFTRNVRPSARIQRFF
jgi:hypothetical protein